MSKRKTLVLNSDFSPIIPPFMLIDSEQAISRVISGTCRVVDCYDDPIKTANPAQLREYGLEKWPSVIARINYLKKKFKLHYSYTNVYLRDKGKCRYCGVPLTKAEGTADHYIPKSLGGKTNFRNIVLSCNSCNSNKGNEEPTGKWHLDVEPSVPGYWDIVNYKMDLPIKIHKTWISFIPEWRGPVEIFE